jgi:hypothetical protein
LSGSRRAALAAALAVAVVLPGAGRAQPPPEDKAIPLEQYTSDKARTLAQRYADDLRALYMGIYHCIPWVEVEKNSVGFQRPRDLDAGDLRYLALRIFIEQDASAVFSALPFRDRASAMYSRYTVPLLRRMTRSERLTRDPDLDGFSIILEWRKHAGGPGDRPVHETLAVFIERTTAIEFLAGRLTPRSLADRARILGWDGETALGPLRVTLYKDDFVATFKVKNYQLAPGVTCP